MKLSEMMYDMQRQMKPRFLDLRISSHAWRDSMNMDATVCIVNSAPVRTDIKPFRELLIKTLKSFN